MLYHKEIPVHNGNTAQEKASFASFALRDFIEELKYNGYSDDCYQIKMLYEALEYTELWANSFSL